ncbi:PIN domain-containing protein [Desulfatibacillum alkenivorans DSM 16219]|jgi:predicted nucleic acid-binding protein|uniref:PIN domain-containing protein n=1 Tax=Desulfatibacillum alkenivorans DSM 16219 TaxID=1121393 RepID=A0A1M6FS67_9BACT|nr:PIN domain-containing protein [Desulfatibacillum alkenivorans]SHJ00558.1 PIN domain-containing protein [Desulfatibacillum alkenivorans DSM 16219]
MKTEGVFLDADVILDLLMEREPHFEPVGKLFLKIQDGEVSAFTSPVIIADLFYILNRHFDRKLAVQSLLKLTSLIKVLSSDLKDFEDAIQYYSAMAGNVPTLITRNVKDYKAAAITIMTPVEYISSC